MVKWTGAYIKKWILISLTTRLPQRTLSVERHAAGLGTCEESQLREESAFDAHTTASQQSDRSERTEIKYQKEHEWQNRKQQQKKQKRSDFTKCDSIQVLPDSHLLIHKPEPLTLTAYSLPVARSTQVCTDDPAPWPSKSSVIWNKSAEMAGLKTCFRKPPKVSSPHEKRQQDIQAPSQICCIWSQLKCKEKKLAIRWWVHSFIVINGARATWPPYWKWLAMEFWYNKITIKGETLSQSPFDFAWGVFKVITHHERYYSYYRNYTVVVCASTFCVDLHLQGKESHRKGDTVREPWGAQTWMKHGLKFRHRITQVIVFVHSHS